MIALATTLADADLAPRSVPTVATGVFTALVVAVGSGLLVGVRYLTEELALRSDVWLYNIFLALASRAAGAYTVVAGAAEALGGLRWPLRFSHPLRRPGSWPGPVCGQTRPGRVSFSSSIS